MSSIFAQMVDALPLHAAMNELVDDGPIEDIRSAPRDYLERLSPSDGYTHPVPDAPSGLTRAAIALEVIAQPPPFDAPMTSQLVNLWGFSAPSGQPNKFSDILCRVRQSGYQVFKVLESLEFGRMAGSAFRAEVRLTTVDGQEIILPLTSRFVKTRLLVKKGHNSGAHPLWPLHGYLDVGMVTAFAYELPPASTPYAVINPLPDTVDADADHALDELVGGGSASDSDTHWGRRAMEGSFMHPPVAGARVSATVGGSADIDLSHPRILVVASLGLFKDRADFEPGGLVGMARIFPHIMVRSTFPLHTIEACVKLDRPARTTTIGAAATDFDHACCSEAVPEVKSILVADANRELTNATPGHEEYLNWLPNNALPMWSNIFAYYKVDPDESWANQRLHVVKRTQRATRIISPCGLRHTIGALEEVTQVTKLPRQGEFDNIHVAPRLRLNAVHAAILHQDGLGLRSEELPGTLDRSAWHLDAVAMAPFCAHDCFHAHWRWSESMGRDFNKGWDATGPYAEAGAPMVARDQDVWLIVRSSHAFTYDVKVTAHEATGLAPYRWNVIMHHGAAYAQGILADPIHRMMNFGAAAVADLVRVGFRDAHGDGLNPLTSNAAFYWNLRYFVAGTTATGYHVDERAAFSDDDLRRAREAT